MSVPGSVRMTTRARLGADQTNTIGLVDNQVGKATDDEFACSFQQSFPADFGMEGQGFDLLPDRAGDSAACCRAVLGDVLPNLDQVLNAGLVQRMTVKS